MRVEVNHTQCNSKLQHDSNVPVSESRASLKILIRKRMCIAKKRTCIKNGYNSSVWV